MAYVPENQDVWLDTNRAHMRYRLGSTNYGITPNVWYTVCSKAGSSVAAGDILSVIDQGWATSLGSSTYAGQVLQTDNTVIGATIGVALHAATAGQPVEVQTSGMYTWPSGKDTDLGTSDIGKVVYVLNNTSTTSTILGLTTDRNIAGAVGAPIILGKIIACTPSMAGPLTIILDPTGDSRAASSLSQAIYIAGEAITITAAQGFPVVSEDATDGKIYVADRRKSPMSFFVSATGTVGTISGGGPWTATVSGLTNVTNISIGATLSATAGVGTLYGGSPTSVAVTGFTSTSITYQVTGGTTPTAGSITNLTATDYKNRHRVVGFCIANSTVPQTTYPITITAGQQVVVERLGPITLGTGITLTSGKQLYVDTLGAVVQDDSTFSATDWRLIVGIATSPLGTATTNPGTALVQIAPPATPLPDAVPVGTVQAIGNYGWAYDYGFYPCITNGSGGLVVTGSGANQAGQLSAYNPATVVTAPTSNPAANGTFDFTTLYQAINTTYGGYTVWYVAGAGTASGTVKINGVTYTMAGTENSTSLVAARIQSQMASTQAGYVCYNPSTFYVAISNDSSHAPPLIDASGLVNYTVNATTASTNGGANAGVSNICSTFSLPSLYTVNPHIQIKYKNWQYLPLSNGAQLIKTTPVDWTPWSSNPGLNWTNTSLQNILTNTTWANTPPNGIEDLVFSLYVRSNATPSKVWKIEPLPSSHYSGGETLYGYQCYIDTSTQYLYINFMPGGLAIFDTPGSGPTVIPTNSTWSWKFVVQKTDRFNRFIDYSSDDKNLQAWKVLYGDSSSYSINYDPLTAVTAGRFNRQVSTAPLIGNTTRLNYEGDLYVTDLVVTNNVTNTGVANVSGKADGSGYNRIRGSLNLRNTADGADVIYTDNTGNLTMVGTLTVGASGNSYIRTAQAAGSLFDTVATTINIGGVVASTTLNLLGSTATGVVNVNSTLDASSTIAAGFVVKGGVGVAGKMYVGTGTGVLYVGATAGTIDTTGGASTAYLFNTNATTINAFGATTTLQAGTSAQGFGYTGTTTNIANSTTAQIINIGTGATTSTSVKEINIGTNTGANAFTNVTIGSSTGTTTITFNGPTSFTNTNSIYIISPVTGGNGVTGVANSFGTLHITPYAYLKVINSTGTNTNVAKFNLSTLPTDGWSIGTTDSTGTNARTLSLTTGHIALTGNASTFITSATGTVGSITTLDTAIWSAIVSGLSSTAGVVVGSTISATTGAGTLYGGSPTSVTVISFTSNTITYRVVGGTIPTAGSVTNITVSGSTLVLPTGSLTLPALAAIGDIPYASSTTVLSKITAVAVGNAFISRGVGTVPAWSKIGLDTSGTESVKHVDGVLQIVNGGLGLSSTVANTVYKTNAGNTAFVASNITDDGNIHFNSVSLDTIKSVTIPYVSGVTNQINITNTDTINNTTAINISKTNSPGGAYNVYGLQVALNTTGGTNAYGTYYNVIGTVTNKYAIYIAAGLINSADATEASQGAGSLILAGGMYIVKKAYCDGGVYLLNNAAYYTALVGASGASGQSTITLNANSGSRTISLSGSLTVGTGGITLTPNAAGTTLSITNTALTFNSTLGNTGVLIASSANTIDTEAQLSITRGGTGTSTFTGTGKNVFDNGPILITPTLGVASATSINGLTISSSTGTLTITNLKTLSVSNTLTLAGTDGKAATFNDNFTTGTLTSGYVIYASAANTIASEAILSTSRGGTGNGFTKFSGPASAEKTKTLRDASDTILELGGSYTPTGTWNWGSATISNLTASAVGAANITGTTLSSTVTSSSLTSFGASIALGTPASGTLTNCSFPTLNQSTTGQAGSVANNLNFTNTFSSGGTTAYNGAAVRTIYVPGQNLETGATVTFSTVTAASFNSTSLRALKKNINDFTQSSLDIIDTVKVVSFNMKDDDVYHVGFIADDTHEYLATRDHNKMDLGNSVGLLIKGMQELREENRKLKSLLGVV